VLAKLEPMQQRYHDLMDDPAELERMLATGADRARPRAEATLARAKDAMGIG
jgi:tryptophanyl-tRNA synthetase